MEKREEGGERRCLVMMVKVEKDASSGEKLEAKTKRKSKKRKERRKSICYSDDGWERRGKYIRRNGDWTWMK